MNTECLNPVTLVLVIMQWLGLLPWNSKKKDVAKTIQMISQYSQPGLSMIIWQDVESIKSEVRLVVGFRVIKLARYLLVYSSIMLNRFQNLRNKEKNTFLPWRWQVLQYWQKKSNMCRLSPFPMRSIVLWCVRRTASGLHLWTTERPTILNQWIQLVYDV